jgi:hypothetical protein
MKRESIIRSLLAIVALVVPIVAGGCPPGSYYGGYTGPGIGGGTGPGYNPPFVYDTTINLYLRVIDPIGYAVPGCDVEVYVSGRYYKSYVLTSGQFWPIYDAFPGEWANFNDVFSVKVNRYEGQTLTFEVRVNHWTFLSVEADYTIPSIDRDSIYVFFDEIIMLPY